MNSKEQIFHALNTLLGTWNSSGKMLAGESSVEAVGTDSYEWLPGEQFMIHKADVMMGNDKVDVIEVIGEYDETKKACAMHAFQNDGSHGLMWASINEDGNLLFAGDTIRATLTVAPNGETMDAYWEQRDDAQWAHWMDMHFAKR